MKVYLIWNETSQRYITRSGAVNGSPRFYPSHRTAASAIAGWVQHEKSFGPYPDRHIYRASDKVVEGDRYEIREFNLGAYTVVKSAVAGETKGESNGTH